MNTCSGVGHQSISPSFLMGAKARPVLVSRGAPGNVGSEIDTVGTCRVLPPSLEAPRRTAACQGP